MKNITFILCGLLFFSSLQAQVVRDHRATGKWTLLPGPAAKDVTINEKGDIFMVSTAGALSKFNGTGWDLLDNTKLTTYAEYGSAKIKVLANGNMTKNFTGYDIKNNQKVDRWDPIEGSDAVDLTITRYIMPGTSTPKIDIMMVNTAGKIYHYHEIYKKWYQLPGSDAVSISGGGDEIWIVNTVGKIYKYRREDYLHRKDDGWDQQPGSNGKDIAIAHDGTKWLVTKNGKVHKWYGGGWAEQVGITGATRVAANKGKVVIINISGQMYQMDY
jgi:hypothetical protein